jgi:hypothetical protein
VDSEIKENFEEALRLESRDQLKDLNKKYQAMISLHAAKGLLRSGATIKKTMEFITEGSEKLYESTLVFIRGNSVRFSKLLESDIQLISESFHSLYFKEAKEWLSKSVNLSSKSELYDRILSEVEAEIATIRARFLNELNREIIKLKDVQHTPAWVKGIYVIEIILILTTAVIAVLWIKDPEGNYEPIIVTLALVIPFLYAVIKLRGTGNLTKLS